MDKETVIKIIQRFQQVLANKGIQANKVILYGSFADCTHRQGSDIDLVVISDDFEDKSYWDRLDILSEAIYEIFEPIEATALTTKEWEQGHSIASELARNGEVFKGLEMH